MPGFPEMSWPMLEWILDTHYPHLQGLRPKAERIITITKGRESDLLPTMNEIVAQYPQLKLSSLPKLGDEPQIEFSLRGDAEQIEQAMQHVIAAVEAAGFIWSDYRPGK